MLSSRLGAARPRGPTSWFAPLSWDDRSQRRPCLLEVPVQVVTRASKHLSPSRPGVGSAHAWLTLSPHLPGLAGLGAASRGSGRWGHHEGPGCGFLWGLNPELLPEPRRDFS